MGGAIGLLLIGLLLIFIEFYLPGAVAGTAGALIFIASLIVATYEFESWYTIVIFYVVAFGLLITLCQWALKMIKSASPESSVYLNDDQEGYKSPQFDAELIGKQGRALTDLRPSGYIFVAGKKVQAISQSTYIEKGTEIEVIDGESSYLIVKELNK
jgi:membrane-bound ClpP family serine protease